MNKAEIKQTKTKVNRLEIDPVVRIRNRNKNKDAEERITAITFLRLEIKMPKEMAAKKPNSLLISF